MVVVRIFFIKYVHLKIVGVRRLTPRNLRTEHGQILGAILQNVVVWDWCTPQLCHPICARVLVLYTILNQTARES